MVSTLACSLPLTFALALAVNLSVALACVACFMHNYNELAVSLGHT